MLNEKRTSPRKVLKTRVAVVFEGAAALTARSLDIGSNGICLSYPEPLPTGLNCELSFDVFLEGKMTTLKTRAKALYCIFSNGEYKVGFQFQNLDLAAITLLAKLMR